MLIPWDPFNEDKNSIDYIQDSLESKDDKSTRIWTILDIWRVALNIFFEDVSSD